MNDQPTLFSALSAHRALEQNAQVPDASYASVVVDVPSRSLSEPFAYAVRPELKDQVQVGSTVLVSFNRRIVAGYVVALAKKLEDLPFSDGLEGKRIISVNRVLAKPAFDGLRAGLAFWISHEYVATLSECLRLFLPPGGSPRVVKHKDGSYSVERPRVGAIHERWVSIAPEGQGFEPRANAVKQKQLLEALSCGPVSTRELNLLYTDMSGAIRALSKAGVVQVEERRAWRGSAATTTLSSARAEAPKELTQGQKDALAAIDASLETQAGDVVVIDGVTGSGKTEVYLSAIEKVLRQGKSACVLVPEISLTAQTVGRFRSRFGETVAVFHSRLSDGERKDQWDMVQCGAARVTVGARSALFLPHKNLGLIIIDEEHEQSYKQGSSPRYHAREVAAELARRCRCPLVLGSATPSMEALLRCRVGTFRGASWTRVEMTERPGGARLPQVVVADLRREFKGGSRSVFSKPLEDALLQVAERGEKAVLLHNRRGFAPFLMCRECGCVPTCRHCSTALTYHERTHTLECHTCGKSYRVRPYPQPGSACPKCGSRYLAKMGMGTQQVEDALVRMVPPQMVVVRMDADSTKGKDGHKELLERFDAADCAVLVGTQMIAKGLDFPEVTLVGVVNADYALKMPDFRASERAYDLLEQVAGRAGRGKNPGKVIVQTYLPEDPVIKAVAAHDRSLFTKHDLQVRADAAYPPFVRLSRVLCWGPDRGETERFINAVAAELRRLVGANNVDAMDAPVVMGPASCVIERAKDRYRFHLLIKSPLGYDISRLIENALALVRQKPGINVSVDIDAYELM